MKILIICNCASGLNTFRGMLIQKLINQGHIVNAIVPKTVDEIEIQNEDDLKSYGCNLFYVLMERRGINPLKDLKLLNDFSQIIKSEKPDLVITYTIKPNVYAGLICRMKNIPYCVNITGLGTAFQSDGLLKKLVIILYKFGIKKAKTVFFENVENRDTIVNYNIVDKKKTCVLNGAGVDLEKFKFESYPQQKNEIHFLFIGRVMKEKGIDELFKAAKKIKSQFKNIHFDIVGRFEDDYKQTILDLSKEGIVEYHGYHNDVRPFIENSHCFVLPSWHEGMANTNLECGAMGRPIITSNIHGCLEAVVDGETGYLVEPRDADDLYEKLKRFIELPYEKKVEMGKASHNHIAEVFDKKKVVENTIERLY